MEKQMKSREELEALARRIRLSIAKMTWQSGLKGAHLGGSMSVTDILAVLYGDVLHYDVNRPLSPERDRLILSKAHAAVALYAALREAGFLTQDDLDHALQGDSLFFEHPMMMPEKGIEFSGGSLGQGLSLGMGTALGLKKKGLFPEGLCHSRRRGMRRRPGLGSGGGRGPLRPGERDGDRGRQRPAV